MTVALDDTAVHDVLFSESDAELVKVAGERLAGALAAGAAAIVIATPEHQAAFVETIRVRGFGVDAAVADGSLLMLDAAETLGELVPDGVFDRASFSHRIGTLVRETAVGRPVQAFGEMVGLLWAEGRYEEAFELEAAWDDLIAETSTSLLCAYSATLFEDPEGAAGIASICAQHTAVVAESPYERTWQFPADRKSAAQARRAVASALRSRGVSETSFYDAQSVITELVANVLAHAGTPFSVAVGVDHERVVLRVGDQSIQKPRPGPPNLKRPGPSGLRLVDELAHRWGIDPHDGGKVVWAELVR